ncbi:MAG: hypothetical protein D6741_16890 [Planctomycetota bacterium]|nr:MAG: hypothetical protein D6741_16890 [Planctomycetota bacterium]
MNAKVALTAVLLLFVVAAVGVTIVRVGSGNTAEEPAAPENTQTTAQAANEEAAAPEEMPKDYVVVYMFHGNVRCPTCLKIEATTKEVLEASFRDELLQRKIVTKEINYESVENKGYITKYDLIAPTVVLARVHDGEETTYKNLMEVWQLVGDPQQFHTFMTEQIQSLLNDEAT